MRGANPDPAHRDKPEQSQSAEPAIARDAAIAFVQERMRREQSFAGYEVDAASRQVIVDAGYGDYFVHRTGHSIGEEVHGNGANMDGLETRDERRVLPGTCFSIEPGIYLQGEFGVRSEINIYMTPSEAIVTGPGRAVGNIHAPNEHNEIPQLHKAVEFYAAFLGQFC